MLVYPQLATGALSQFPVRKQSTFRTVVNTAADGRQTKYADPAGEVREWQLAYAGLSDDEIGALEQFFTAAEGTLNGFTFLDPTANLLAWSEHLDEAVWQTGPLIALASGVADPVGGTNAWHISNSGGGPQSITQTLSAPGGYVYCFSAYVRSAQAVTATMLLASQRADRAATAGWTRIVVAGSGAATDESITFGLEIPAGAAVDVYGMQVEPQASASVYKTGTTGGVYEGARLGDDAFTDTTTDVNRHSCTVKITHANHL